MRALCAFRGWLGVSRDGGSCSKRNCLATGSSGRILPGWQGVARGGKLANEKNRTFFLLATTNICILHPITHCILVGYHWDLGLQAVQPIVNRWFLPRAVDCSAITFHIRTIPEDRAPREVVLWEFHTARCAGSYLRGR